MRYGTAVILVASAGFLWSLQGLVFRQIEAAEPWAVLFWRSLGMVPPLLAFLAWRGGALAGLRRIGLAGVIGGLGLVGAFGGAVYSIQTTTVANAVFLFAAAPLLTALLAWAVLGERTRPETWGAIGLALLGIFVMVRHGLSGGALAGNLAALLSALGFAIFTVSLRWRGVTDAMPAVLLGALMAMSAGGLAAAAAGAPLAVPLPDIFWAVFMGAGLLTGGLVLYTLGSRVLPAAELTLLSGIEVMLAPVWVWLVLGETADANTLLGGAFILAAVVWNGCRGPAAPCPTAQERSGPAPASAHRRTHRPGEARPPASAEPTPALHHDDASLTRHALQAPSMDLAVRLLRIASLFAALAGLAPASWAGHELDRAALRQAIAEGKAIPFGDLRSRVEARMGGEIVDVSLHQFDAFYYRVLVRRADGNLVSAVIDAKRGTFLPISSDAAQAVQDSARRTSSGGLRRPNVPAPGMPVPVTGAPVSGGTGGTGEVSGSAPGSPSGMASDPGSAGAQDGAAGEAGSGGEGGRRRQRGRRQRGQRRQLRQRRQRG
jgi:drug/metabolite transporter, DME family